MPENTTPAKAAAPKTGAMRTLDDAEFARRATGRKNKYVENVREAAKTPGKGFAIDLVTGDKPASIISQLYRAAEELGVKVTAINRSQESEPYIGFKVVPASS